MNKTRVAITIGDPSGIGSEIIANALAKKEILNLADFVIIGDKWVFDQIPDTRYQIPGVKFIDLNNVQRKTFRFGKLSKEHGKAALEYIDKALELIKNCKIDCLVTCPVSKEAIIRAGFDFVGHTEYLAKKTHTKDVLMMLVVDKLRVSVVTRHIPLKEVSSSINSKDIFKTIQLSWRGLKEYFGIKEPKIGICSLNPHSGEGGLLGKEEEKVIIPAIKKAGYFSRYIKGPLAADSIFSSALRDKFDCIVAMYHDQGLIPIKMQGFERGVNFTIGLPFIRTSPDHGCAFDIAGKNIASCSSLIEAMKLAVKCQKKIS